MPTCGNCHREAPQGALFCSFCGGAIKPEGEGESDPLIGTTVSNKYFVNQLLGRGGMGDVYKATHLTLDRPVVVKLLKKSFLSDPSLVQRFHREARAASRLNHPNSISIIDFGQADDGTLFMAMEYLSGRSLASVIGEDWPIAEERIVHIGAQILSALAEAHALGVIHRDLKPANVMLEPRRDDPDFVKVLDFGIAKLNEPGDGAARLTQAGTVCGTPGYMSPEQVYGEELDPRSDLYAVGVILYEMITGLQPFEADTTMGLVTKHLTEPPPPLEVRRPGVVVSPDLAAIVMWALQKSREQRPASAEEMRAHLLAANIRREGPPRTPIGVPQATMVFDPAQLKARTPVAAAAQSPSPPAPSPVPSPGAAPWPATPAPRPATPSPMQPAPGTAVLHSTPPPVTRTPMPGTALLDATPPPASRTPVAGTAVLEPVVPSTPQTPSPAAFPPKTPGAQPAQPRTPAGRPVQQRTPAPAAAPAKATPRARPRPPAGGEPGERAELHRAAAKPPSRGKLPLVAGGAAAAVVIAGLVIWGVLRGTKKEEPPPADTVRPSIVSTSPPDAAIGIPVDQVITVAFSEPMAKEALRLRIDPAAGLGAPTWSPDARSFTVRTLQPLAGRTTYTLVVQGTDAAGNAVAGTSMFRFTTKELAPPPAVVSTSPADGEAGVSPRPQIVVTFSKQMDPATVALRLGGAAVEQATWSADRKVATFQPSTLGHDERVEAEVSGKDQGGVGLSPGPVRFSFTTAPAPVARPERPPVAKGIREKRPGVGSLPTPPARSGEGILAVDATPWAVVYVDGERVIETPCSIRLGAGSYKIRAEYLPKVPPKERTIVINAGKREVWTLTFAR